MSRTWAGIRPKAVEIHRDPGIKSWPKEYQTRISSSPGRLPHRRTSNRMACWVRVAAGRPSVSPDSAAVAILSNLAFPSEAPLLDRTTFTRSAASMFMDSSLTARKQLAQELGYKGELNGSAEMNTWLHKQVMTKLAESGGVVPESLKHA